MLVQLREGSQIDMDYWPTARWKIAVSTGDMREWVEPTLPFVLIGSHACCEVQILDKRVPDVAYIACCFTDSVEVWPVCPIAFPRWGIAEPQHELMVGRSRISLFHPAHQGWEKACPGERVQPHAEMHQSPLPQITLEWGGKPRPKTLYRRVTILGQDHPSTLRMYGQGMRRCDRAIVAANDWLGLISLVPGECSGAEDLVRRLAPGVAPIRVGRVMVSIGRSFHGPNPNMDVHLNGDGTGTIASPATPCLDSPGKSRIQTSETGRQEKAIIAESPAPTGERFAGIKQPTRPAPPLEASNEPFGVQQHASAPPVPRARVPKSKDRPGATATTVSKQSRPSIRSNPKTKRRRSPEALTTDVTDRLVSMDQDRFSQRRIVIQSAYTAGFIIAGAVLAWVLFSKLLPLIAEIAGAE